MSEIISFYSYKGGVGRSMALANVATLLAQRGRRVLVVDFDLEAPGLHRYFLGPGTRPEKPRQNPLEGQRGLIDLFVELHTKIAIEDKPAPGIVSLLLDSGRFGYSVNVGFPASMRSAQLDFLSAGLFDSGYAQRVHDFPWIRFYEEWGEVFTQLATEWKQRYDYILLDSRTGVSDLGSVSTVILADKLVLAFTPNEQSLHGVRDFGRQAVALKQSIDETRLLPLFPLLSRLDEGEETQSRQWIAAAVKQFESLFNTAYGHCEVDFSAYFEAVRIPHRGYYAFGEKIAVEEERSATLGSLAEGYERFVDCLEAEDLSGWTRRIWNTVRTRRGDGALVVSFERPFEPPTELELVRVVRAPAEYLPDQAERLRTTPVDRDAWTQALTAIDMGVERALDEIPGDLHVFAALPYPAAVYLGRRLDQWARSRLLWLYQYDPIVQGWLLFSSPGREPGTLPKRYYQPLKEWSELPEREAVLLAIEGVSPISKSGLEALANSLGAITYHLKAEHQGFLRPADVPRAVMDLRETLLQPPLSRSCGGCYHSGQVGK